MTVLVTGATGFVGGLLSRRLLADGFRVRCLTRDPESEYAQALEREGGEIAVADLTVPNAVGAALDGIDVAYFLVHMIDDEDDYPEVERAAAGRFARAAKRAGTERVIYLGGLGEPSGSRHLAARHRVASTLAREGPPLTYFRAAMVIGPGSESYELLRGIDRLPVVPAPEWLHTKTQPIGTRDLVAYLREALDVEEAVGREIQIGGPDIVTHLELVERMARALGRQPPRFVSTSAEIARPATIAAGAGAVTDGTPRIATEISHGLSTPSVVTDPGGAALFAVRPRPLDEVLGDAVDEASIGARSHE
jgi:uncharacterized protein YbjT (DUF2867 family)